MNTAMSAIILCLSLTPLANVDRVYSGTLLHLAGSSLNGLLLWINLWAYLFGLVIRFDSEDPFPGFTSMIDFPGRIHDDRTSQTECHFIKLRSRCLTKTPKKTPSTKTAGSALKLRIIPLLPRKTPLLG